MLLSLWIIIILIMMIFSYFFRIKINEYILSSDNLHSKNQKEGYSISFQIHSDITIIVSNNHRPII